jgi:hypothetical protein
MTKNEALRLALEALEVANSCVDGYYIPKGKTHLPEIELAITAIKAVLEAKDEPWTQDDMAYRPNGLPQEFIKHEVESPEDWSEWVCPNPDEYFMKCCDCGLVHEVQYRVARYGEGDYCELVDDQDVQAQFRMRRRTQPQRTWVGLTYKEESDLIRLAHNHAGIRFYIQAAEAKLKEKNT